MAVSGLQQRRVPLVLSCSAWAPWGIGIVAPNHEDSDARSDDPECELKPSARNPQRSQSWGGYSTHSQLTRRGLKPMSDDDDEFEAPQKASSERCLAPRARKKQRGRKSQRNALQVSQDPEIPSSADAVRELHPTLLGSIQPDTTKSNCCDKGPDATTLAIRNLPYSLSQQDFVQVVDDSGFAGLYDFVYMPHKFKEHRNLGFAFMNFVDGVAAQRFTAEWQNSYRFQGMRKPVNITPAAKQGREANVQNAVSRKMDRVKNASFRPMMFGPLLI